MISISKEKASTIFLFISSTALVILTYTGMKLFNPVLIAGVVLVLGIASLVLRNPVIGLFGLAFFLPFERVGSYDFAGVTIRLSQIFTIFAWTGFLLHGLWNKKFDLKKNPLFFPLLFFLLINFLSLINAENRERSTLILLFTIFTITVALLLPNLITQKKHLRTMLKALFYSTLIVTLFGFYQFLGDMAGLPPLYTGLRDHYTKAVLGFPRIQSTALEPLYFANFLLIPIGLLYALFLSRGKTFRKNALFILLLFAGVNLVLTVSRGGYLGLLGTLTFITLFYLRNFLTPRRVASFLILLIAVGWISIKFLNVDNNLETFIAHTTGVFQGASFEERIETFQTAFGAFVEHPWIGIGVGGFGPYSSIHPYVKPEGGWYIVNNELLELLAEVGILGLLSFLTIIAIILIRSAKAIVRSRDELLRPTLVGLVGAFLGVLIQYQTFSILYIMHVWFLIGSIISVQNLIFAQQKKVQVKVSGSQ